MGGYLLAYCQAPDGTCDCAKERELLNRDENLYGVYLGKIIFSNELEEAPSLIES